ncbi:MAG: carboxypeptidase regulatory-like domain-containing protein, partial [Bacteroidales bacterium]|nr:carboxypeptidase regulatory-like domain-containing protein [Bacteroidales bacterium]
LITSTITEADGYYSMLGIPAGLYNLFAATEGFETDTIENVQIVEGNRTVQNFKLSPAEPVEEE